MSKTLPIPQPKIDVVVLVYDPEPLVLSECVESAARETSGSIIVAINNDDPLVIKTVRTTLSTAPAAVHITTLGFNWGYAEGINRALPHAKTELVLLLNDDAMLTPGALSSLSEELESAGNTTVGVVPKIVYKATPSVIDAVGAFTTSRAATHNRGSLEVDAGQYDNKSEVFGACFAAVLLRRSAFSAAEVGKLEASFFMYVEDADWCLRARLRGYKFFAVPSAVVLHVHSASTAEFAASFKEDLIERNSWITSIRCFPAHNATFVSAARLVRHLRRSALGPDRARSLRLLFDVATKVPAALRARKDIRGGLIHRSRNDRLLFPDRVSEHRKQRGTRPLPGH